MRIILAFAFLTFGTASKLPLNPTATQIFIVQAPIPETRYQEQDSNGFYSFGYNGDTSAKAEYKTLDGSSRGFYSYIDADGKLQTVRYEAGKDQGFRAAATNLPQAPIDNGKPPPPVRDTPEVQKAKLAHFEAVREAEQRNEAERRQESEKREQIENNRNAELMEKAAEQMMQLMLANNRDKTNENSNGNSNENNNGNDNIEENEDANLTADDVSTNSNENENEDNENNSNENNNNNTENDDNIDNSGRQPCDISEAYDFSSNNDDDSSSFAFDDFQTKALKDITSFKLKNSFDDINRLNLRTIYNLENEKSSSVLRLPDFSKLRRPSKSTKSKSQKQQKSQQQSLTQQLQTQNQQKEQKEQQSQQSQQPIRREEWVLPALASYEEIRIPSDAYYTVIAPSNQYSVQTPTIYTSVKRPSSANNKLPISLSSTFSSQRINGKARARARH